MLEKKILNKSTEIELALPDDGFSPEFINTLLAICMKYNDLNKSYLVLKKEGENISLLLGLLFFENSSYQHHEKIIQKIMTEVLDLFSDEIIIETVYLNNNNQLKKAVESMDSLFYSALSSENVEV